METPSDLIQDKNRTPFNIGRAIALSGFQLGEIKPLAMGLVEKVSNPKAAMQEVLDWTGGQLFLTQKLCKLILQQTAENPQFKIEDVVRSLVIENWESHDEQGHLKTIRDRILCSKQRTSRLLGLYQQVLQVGEIVADDSSEQMELRLLRGQALQDALAWAAGKSLSARDYQFLTASQQVDKREVQIALAAEKEASQLLAEANQTLTGAQQKAQQRIRIGSRILIASLIVATTSGIQAGKSFQSLQETQEGLRKAQEVTKLEQAGVNALRQFELAQMEALVSAMRSGQGLKAIVRDEERPLEKYPATSPLFALQTILDSIRERNQIDMKSGSADKVSFIADGKRLAMLGEDSMVRLWNLSGQLLAEFKGHQDLRRSIANSISVNPDSKHLATGGGGKDNN